MARCNYSTCGKPIIRETQVHLRMALFVDSDRIRTPGPTWCFCSLACEAAWYAESTAEDLWPVIDPAAQGEAQARAIHPELDGRVYAFRQRLIGTGNFQRQPEDVEDEGRLFAHAGHLNDWWKEPDDQMFPKDKRPKKIRRTLEGVVSLVEDSAAPADPAAHGGGRKP